MNQKKSFILYCDLYNQIVRLSPEDRGALFLAILEYAKFGEAQTPMSPLISLAFSFVQADMDRDHAAYEERCRRNNEYEK